MPKKKIVTKTIIWFIILTVASIAALIICQMAYMSQGIDPTQLTKFGGDVTTRMDKPLWQTVSDCSHRRGNHISTRSVAQTASRVALVRPAPRNDSILFFLMPTIIGW